VQSHTLRSPSAEVMAASWCMLYRGAVSRQYGITRSAANSSVHSLQGDQATQRPRRQHQSGPLEPLAPFVHALHILCIRPPRLPHKALYRLPSGGGLVPVVRQPTGIRAHVRDLGAAAMGGMRRAVDLLRNVLRGSTVVLSAVHAQLITVERSLSRSSYRPPPESLHVHSAQHSHHQHQHRQS